MEKFHGALLVFLLTSLLFSSIGVSNPVLVGSVVPTEFNRRYTTIPNVKPEDRPTGWDKNISAVNMITIYSTGSEETCTSTQISSEGHVLLNLHCLTDCLSGQAINLSGSSGKIKNPPILYRFDQRRSLGHQCTVSFGKTGSRVQATVVALGRGYITPRNLSNGHSINASEFYSWLEDDSDDNDYAVIRINGYANRACAPLAKSNLITASKVWSLSFPGKTNRDDGSHIPGSQKLFTSGYVRSAYIASPSVTVVAAIPANKCSDTGPLPPHFGEGLFSSSLDVAPGASGSAIFNEQGEITGLLRGESTPLDGNCNATCTADKCGYRDGMAMGIDIQTVARNIRQDFGDQVLNDSFNCQ